ncbi:MAG: hypothetical protein D6803_01060 [Anaerolineae bacterium]|nr:MAG: hypothetical protein D6803_01060 [Anaerolineae bacterium]
MKSHSVAYFRRYLQAAQAALDGYLLSEDLYWPIDARPPAGEGTYPALTLGTILLYLRIFTSLVPQAEAQQMETAFWHLRERWRVAWERKAARDWAARLRQWGQYVGELQTDVGNAGYYAYQVRLRVILELLLQERLPLSSDDLDVLKGMDVQLRAMWRMGAFLWPPEMAAAFPEQPFWFLWGEISG